jgi:hypothetical protein
MRDQMIEVGQQFAKHFQQSIVASRILRKQLPGKEIPNATRAVRKDGRLAISLCCERHRREEMTWKFKMLAELVARITLHILLANILPQIAEPVDNLEEQVKYLVKQKQTFWKKYVRSWRDEGNESR